MCFWEKNRSSEVDAHHGELWASSPYVLHIDPFSALHCSGLALGWPLLQKVLPGHPCQWELTKEMGIKKKKKKLVESLEERPEKRKIEIRIPPSLCHPLSVSASVYDYGFSGAAPLPQFQVSPGSTTLGVELDQLGKSVLCKKYSRVNW